MTAPPGGRRRAPRQAARVRDDDDGRERDAAAVDGLRRFVERLEHQDDDAQRRVDYPALRALLASVEGVAP